MMYAAEAKISYRRKKVKYYRYVKFDEAPNTLEALARIVKPDETFSIDSEKTCAVHIHGYRLETREEVLSRVAKGKEYNRQRQIFLNRDTEEGRKLWKDLAAELVAARKARYKY